MSRESHHPTHHHRAPQPDLDQLRALVEEQRQEIARLRHLLISKHNHSHSNTSHASNQTCSSSYSIPSLFPLSNLHIRDDPFTQTSLDIATTLALPALMRGFTTTTDVPHIHDICRTLVTDHTYGSWQTLFKAFYDIVVETRDSMPTHVTQMESTLGNEWHLEPWYLMYPHHFGVPPGNSNPTATFDDLSEMLPYIQQHLGFDNICLLPHYESPMGDGGYDVSAFEARAALGGEDAFDRFMKEAIGRGMRVATDAVFNHTSTEHPWFQRALAGEDKYLGYYLQTPGREKIAEYDRDGDIICRYRDNDGTITERVVVFPDIDRTHGLWVEINGKTYQFYRSFYPFQVDLNLQNPQVLIELMHILAKELKQGVMCKRMDAAVHWVKHPGTTGEGLVECHAVHALLKSFMRHINSRAMVMPEVVRDMRTTAKYAGELTSINGMDCPSQGDALFSFETQAALRECTYFQTTIPLWRAVFRQPSLPKGATWLNLLEHHDETFMGFFPRQVRVWMAEYIKTHNGVVYKNGMSAGGRIADCLNEDENRISLALFILFVIPGTPLVYAGTEYGATSNKEHAEYMMDKSHETFQRLGVYADRSSCFDPRELQRGPQYKDLPLFEMAMNYSGIWMVKEMIKMRKKYRCLRDGEARGLDTGDTGVLAMGRVIRGEEENSLILLANLSATEKKIHLKKSQALAMWGIEMQQGWEKKWIFVDVLQASKMSMNIQVQNMTFDLVAFSALAIHAQRKHCEA